MHGMRMAHREGKPHTFAYRAKFDAAFPGFFCESYHAYFGDEGIRDGIR